MHAHNDTGVQARVFLRPSALQACGLQAMQRQAFTAVVLLLQVLYEDEDIACVVKPPGIPTHVRVATVKLQARKPLSTLIALACCCLLAARGADETVGSYTML